MTVKSKQLFILIGDDKTGKTTFQKLLIQKVNGAIYAKLPTNVRLDILHPEIKRKYQTISLGNRSYQEKLGIYGSVVNYFQHHFSPADISIISSHLNMQDIVEMIRNGKERFYNVTGIFFSNSVNTNPQVNSNISGLDWDERLFIENELTEDEKKIYNQLNSIVENFVVFLSNRTSIS